MTKIIALTVLHYGRPYLGWAMQSLVDYVDEYWILYAPNPSHNGGTASLPCPDSEWELRDIAQTVAGDKLRWVKGDWKYEGQQRDAIYSLCPDADVILVTDYDEVWPTGLPETAINAARQHSGRAFRVPMIHHWRSFYKCVLHDPAYPVRVISPKNQAGEKVLYTQPQKYISHFGYAIPPEYMAYKWAGIHGHQNELRRDWYRDVYMTNAQENCHPVGSEYWNPETINPWDYLPSFMKAHPYAKLEVIE